MVSPVKSVEIIRWEMGPLKTNCYMVVSQGEAVVIDAGFPRESLEAAEFILDREINVKMFIATHGHFDHVLGFDVMRRRLKKDIPLYIHIGDVELLKRAGEAVKKYFGIDLTPPKPDRFLEGGEELEIGDVKLKVIHTPGHTMGSISLYSEEGFVFTGDTLFKRSIGRCDFPESNCEYLARSLQKLFTLPPDTKVYPGHMDETTIGDELLLNPYVREFLK